MEGKRRRPQAGWDKRHGERYTIRSTAHVVKVRRECSPACSSVRSFGIQVLPSLLGSSLRFQVLPSLVESAAPFSARCCRAWSSRQLRSLPGAGRVGSSLRFQVLPSLLGGLVLCRWLASLVGSPLSVLRRVEEGVNVGCRSTSSSTITSVSSSIWTWSRAPLAGGRLHTACRALSRPDGSRSARKGGVAFARRRAPRASHSSRSSQPHPAMRAKSFASAPTRSS